MKWPGDCISDRFFGVDTLKPFVIGELIDDRGVRIESTNQNKRYEMVERTGCKIE